VSKLAGRVIVVTGGGSGIGRATSLALAREGADVVVVDVNEAGIEQTLAELNGPDGPGKHIGIVADVGDEGDMERMARRTLETFERIDGLVAGAGILRGRGSWPRPLVEISTEEWDQVLRTNLRGTFLSNRAVLPAMIRQKRGDIVNISSVSGRQGRPHDAPYCASKFGIVGMSESLAEEVRRLGVRVQLILPDAVATPIWSQNGPVPAPVDALPPERVADLIVFLIAQPPDTLLLSPVIAPFRSRARGRRPEGGTP
jgi:3-oxoacyl-[acyl-carrier protein] reductase